ncbi:uncharacterized protein LOC127129562 [Lathyrus oleraceus]|uniref:uncharacterized protein LOC127129562 n=1 Tax=Pisum sativum TaxID=3888 RepID=UPI0021D09526|nr:uncharacterized protein LOC127129562 [Pisum sativum]
MVRELELLEQFRDMSLVCEKTPTSVKLVALKRTSGILKEIREGKKIDLGLVNLLVLINQCKSGDFQVDENGVTRFKDRVCVPDVLELKKSILEEGHCGKLSIHTGATKILTKSAHFIPLRFNYSLQKLAKLYIEKIVSLHGIPSSIISDRDLRFTLSIGMEPYQTLYGRRCKTPMCWYETSESVMIGPKIV